MSLQENDLLVAQQTELDAEIQRLHAQLSEQSTTAAAITAEHAAMVQHTAQQQTFAQVGAIGLWGYALLAVREASTSDLRIQPP
jgi:hypothetical protein